MRGEKLRSSSVTFVCPSPVSTTPAVERVTHSNACSKRHQLWVMWVLLKMKLPSFCKNAPPTSMVGAEVFYRVLPQTHRVKNSRWAKLHMTRINFQKTTPHDMTAMIWQQPRKAAISIQHAIIKTWTWLEKGMLFKTSVYKPFTMVTRMLVHSDTQFKNGPRFVFLHILIVTYKALDIKYVSSSSLSSTCASVWHTVYSLGCTIVMIV